MCCRRPRSLLIFPSSVILATLRIAPSPIQWHKQVQAFTTPPSLQAPSNSTSMTPHQVRERHSRLRQSLSQNGYGLTVCSCCCFDVSTPPTWSKVQNVNNHKNCHGAWPKVGRRGLWPNVETRRAWPVAEGHGSAAVGEPAVAPDNVRQPLPR